MIAQQQTPRHYFRTAYIVFLFLITLFLSTSASAREVSLQWDANEEPQLLGYRIYYDTDSGAPYEGIDADQGASPIEMPLAAFADPDNPQATLTGLSEISDYFFAVTAYSADEESGYSNEASIEGGQQDLPLVAEAGPNQSVDEGVNVSLDGSNSYDMDDDITDYLWTQTNGPNVSLSDATAVQPTFSAPDVDEGGETLIFQLTVTNDQGHNASDTVTINVTWQNIPPAADAGNDQTVDEGETVTLNGSNSYDMDDGLAAYAWTQTGGPTVALSDETAAQPTFTAPDVDSDGVALTFQLTVTDNNGLQDTDTVMVNVTWQNIPPTAHAGDDQTVDEGVTVTLDGSLSDDMDDGLASYAWSQTGGPNVTLSDATAVTPTFTAPEGTGGTFLTFELVVTDTGGLQASDEVIVTVEVVEEEDLPLVADAGSNQTVDEGGTVTLDGSNSHDPDDAITEYLWTQTSGPNVTLSDATAMQPTFGTPNVDEGGATLTFQLSVTNEKDLSATDTVTINVTWQNIPPHADAGVDQAVDEEATVTLDGSNSYDMDDGLAAYAWTQTGGPSVTLSDATAAKPTFTSPDLDSQSAALTFQLTVTDSNGLQDTDTVTINVTWDNIPPHADAGDDRTVNEGALVSLDGSNSYDLDDGLASYTWTQTSGPNVTLSDATAATPTFTAPDVDEGGKTLVFQLTVADSNGLQDTDTVIINVTWQNFPPTADAGADQSVDEGETVTLNGSLSSDPDDGLAAYSWTQTEGPAVTLSDSTALNPTFVTVPVDTAGSYLAFELVVTDAGGLKASDEVVITINDNRISGFANDVLTLSTVTGDPIGLTLSGGNLIKLNPLASSDVLNNENGPDSLIYGLLDITIKADAIGGTAILTVHLPSPAPEGYTWFNYDPNEGWRDCSEQVTFNKTRDEIAIALVDGGLGDDDGVVNGIIEDPAGLGTRAVEVDADDTAADSANTASSSYPVTAAASGGCFISSVSPFGSGK